VQYRRNTLYRVLGAVFLLIGVLLIVLSLLLALALRIALILIGVFVLVIALSYFRLSTRQNKGS
jgi:multisubunit Na+/H+ antiporter MnhG subunit